MPMVKSGCRRLSAPVNDFDGDFAEADNGNRKGGRNMCQRPGHQSYIDSDGDVVCLNCGWREVIAAPVYARFYAAVLAAPEVRGVKGKPNHWTSR